MTKQTDNKNKRVETRTTRFYGIDFMEKKIQAGSYQKLIASKESIAIEKLENPKKYFRKAYGPFLCLLLLTSLFTIILGTSLLLAGYYVPRLTVENILTGEYPTPDDIIKIHNYNTRLKTLRLAGGCLLISGGFGLILLFIMPAICLQKRNCQLNRKERCDSKSIPQDLTQISYIPAPKYNLSMSEKSGYSVVKQHIQPKKNKQQYRKIKQTYDKGFLSPELNRGPIFVSDNTHRLNSRNITDEDLRRNRSSSDVQLSPNNITRNKPRTSSWHDASESSRGTPVKAGSFYSLE